MSNENVFDDTLVSKPFLAGLLEKLGVSTGQHIDKRLEQKLAPLQTRIAQLETRCGAMAMILGRGVDGQQKLAAAEAVFKRLDALEAKAVQFRGVFVDGQDYEHGDLVQRSGSLWICLRSTSGTPSRCSDWKLAVKRGTVGDE